MAHLRNKLVKMVLKNLEENKAMAQDLGLERNECECAHEAWV